MHIAPFDNQNQPIVDVGNDRVPLNYFNIVKLQKGQKYSYTLSDYESCIVPATGRVSVSVNNRQIAEIGLRTEDVWDGEPEGVYVPTALSAQLNAFLTVPKFSWQVQNMRKRSRRSLFWATR